MEEACGCKGIRTCSICEKIGKTSKQILFQDKYKYCYKCQKAWFESTDACKDNEKLERMEFSTDKEGNESSMSSNDKKRLHSTNTNDVPNIKAKPKRCEGHIGQSIDFPGTECEGHIGQSIDFPGIECEGHIGQSIDFPGIECEGHIGQSIDFPGIECEGHIGQNIDFPGIECEGHIGQSIDFPGIECQGHMGQSIDFPGIECEGHIGQSIDFPGIHIYCDFVNEEEEMAICDKIYETPFSLSQSGRRKQDYGPKVNFKKRKLKVADFTGLPEYSEQLYHKMKKIPIVSDFQPVELCNLEYSSDRGSSIDPHFDDFWLWGERLVTLNLLSDSVLCFTNEEKPWIEVNVPMFRRSLLVVYGPARHKWKHAVHRCDIINKRIAITFRELSDEFKHGGQKELEGTNLLDIALTFKGQAVGTKKNIVDNSEP